MGTFTEPTTSDGKLPWEARSLSRRRAPLLG